MVGGRLVDVGGESAAAVQIPLAVLACELRLAAEPSHLVDVDEFVDQVDEVARVPLVEFVAEVDGRSERHGVDRTALAEAVRGQPTAGLDPTSCRSTPGNNGWRRSIVSACNARLERFRLAIRADRLVSVKTARPTEQPSGTACSSQIPSVPPTDRMVDHHDTSPVSHCERRMNRPPGTRCGPDLLPSAAVAASIAPRAQEYVRREA